MGSSSTLPPWWDREIGDSGLQLRADVRAAAKDIWPQVRVEVERVLGDANEAHEVLEKAVQSVSAYLQKRGIEPHDPSKLLMVAVYRIARRLARKRGRLQLVGDSVALWDKLRAPDWLDHVDRRIFLEQLVMHLRPDNRGILRLRLEDFSWEEIARMRGANANVVRKEFWRDVRRAHLQLLQQPTLPKRGQD
jgi:DNA-directed RNA polymerase specialized sigma24 family protein